GTGTPSAPSAASASLTFTTSVSNANADLYTFVITDANGCPTTTSATVTPITNPTVAVASQVNVSCTGGNDGSITLSGSGGSGGYTYSNLASSGYTATATFGGLTAAGSPYTFYVRDNKGCQNSVVVTITQPANALAATVTEVPFSCSPSNTKVSGTVTINVTAGTGTSPYTYSFNGGAFTSNNVLTLNDNGSNQPYTYAVQDAKGCPISGSGTLLPLNNPVIGTITSTPIYCAPAATTSTVTVPVNAGTGVGTLSYTIVSGPITNTSGATTGVFSGLTSGNYVFRVTDAKGCYDTESYFVSPVTPIVATATKLTDVDCFGNTTGSIRYAVSGFGGTYSYTINGGSPVTGQTAGTFDLITRAAGTYAVVFTDDITSCTASTSVTITQPAQALAATYTTVNANCNVPTASVTVTATGGTATYRYSFVTSSTTPGTYGTSNVANLNPTTSTSWFAHIIDANNCTFILPITIASDPIPTVTATGTGCLGTPGGYTITAANTTTPAAGIITPIRYSINNGASYQATNVFTVTTAGTYTVTMIDGNGCIATAPSIIVAPQLTLNAVLNKDITCVVGDEPARITVTPTGGSGSFTYAITTPATEATNVTGAITGIFTTSVPGNYTFTVTDTTTGCTYTTTAAIPVTTAILPDITSITQTAFINCNGDDTGAIRANFNASLGLAPFEFSIDGTSFQSSNTFTGLSQGTYTITIRDAKGCIDTESITITEPGLINFVLSRVPIQCMGGMNTLGSITVANVVGGTGSFRYFITNNFGSVVTPNPYVATSNEDFTFTIIDFGIYTVTVVDANGCSLSKQITMTSPPTSLNIAVNVTTPDCISGGTATVTVGAPVLGNSYDFGIVNSNIPPYTSTFNPANNGPYSYNFTGLTPGVTYSFVVRDNVTGCLFVNTATSPINPASSITAALTPNNVTCVGANDGSVTMTVSGFTNTATSIDYQIFRQQSNSTVGGVINQPVSGGTPFTFTYPAPGSLPAGQYYIVYIENGGVNNGCKASFPFEIKESSVNLSVIATVISNENCNQGGVISAQARDGAGSYEYLINTTNVFPTALTAGWQTGNTFSNLVANTYYVFTKDAFGCIQPAIARVLTRDLEPTIALPAPICYNGTPFTIDLVTDASALATILPATYKVEPIASLGTATYQNGSAFTFNAAGTYRLYIKDGNGCVAFVDYTVLPQLQLTPTLTKVLDCSGTPNATITLNTTGGNTTPAPNYTYEVNFNSGGFVAATTPYSAAAPGSYEFRVTDANNPTLCQTTATIVLDPIPATIIATPVVKDVSCNGGSDGTITVTVTSGEGPYTYVLSGTTTNTSGDASGVYTGLPVGNYVVTVRNGRGCLQASTSITVAQPTLLAATAAAALNTTCSNTTVITVTASQGSPSTVGTGYTYSFNGLSYTSDNTFTVNNGPVATTTTISVKDANGCTLALPNVITPALTPPTNLTFAVTTAPTCPANTATVQVTATGGLGSLDFDIIEFNNVPTTLYLTQSTAGSGTPTSFANLPPGDYIFRVTDDNGCTYQELYTVVPVTPIAIVGALVNDITCNPANGTTNNGSARFTVTGFSSTGNYSINVTSVPALLPFTQLPLVGDVITLTGLNAGTYTVTVTDNTTLCVASDAVTITLPNPIAFTTAATKVFCTQDISQITVSAVTGGSGAYQYAVLPGGTVTPPAMGAYNTNPVLSVDTNLTVLSWDVYVMDAKGCVGMQNVTVVNNAAPTI
ncbi:hypothetical protein DNC80_13060, partial [Flavobacterium sp. SOK18b]|uniref:beta strand repeat-containing protein n=1 Tax=Flavobacterium sp. SOK18b TaxID=797900 RepID=UPI0015FA9CA5